jgi:hypothetical protein
MKLKNYEIKAYVTKDLHERVRLEALAKNTKMAMIIRDSLAQYFLIQEELASAIETPGNLGESHNGKIIHILLARTEERIELAINDLDNKLEETHQKLHLLVTMVDQFYLNIMQYFPKIPENFLADAQELAKLRHEEWFSITNKHLKRNK